MSRRKLLQWRTWSQRSIVRGYSTLNNTHGHSRTADDRTERRPPISSRDGSNRQHHATRFDAPDGDTLVELSAAKASYHAGLLADSPKTQQQDELDLQLVLPSFSNSEERNAFYRNAFSKYDTKRERREQLLGSELVPPIRDYPSRSMTAVSLREARKAASANAGYTQIWKQHRLTQPPGFKDTFNQLKLMSALKEQGGLSNASAIRIVLPSTFRIMARRSERVRFVDSVTGLLSGLRVLPHHQDPSSIILRGEDTTLRTAADEFIKAIPGVEVLELGKVSALDYEAKKVWPTIELSPPKPCTSRGALFNMKLESSREPILIKHPFEELEKPHKWTSDNFEEYLTRLIRCRIPSELVLKLYKRDDAHGRHVDVNQKKIKLIEDAITDPDARIHITPSTFNMALEFLADSGGHIARANKLFTLAEEWGIPLDTPSFNIMLRAYARNRNIGLFKSFLMKMSTRMFKPDAQTWLCFLEIVGKDEARRMAVAAMHQLGYVDNVAARRGIARVMAVPDAYSAFKSGKTMTAFLEHQKKLYGDRWLSSRAAPDIITQYLAFAAQNQHKSIKEVSKNIQALLDHPTWDSSRPGEDFFDAILSFATHTNCWPLALYAIRQARAYNVDLSPASYAHLIDLAVLSKSPHALSVIFFFAVFERRLRTVGRRAMLRLFRKPTTSWWGRNKPRLMTQKMSETYKQRRPASRASPTGGNADSEASTARDGDISAIEWAMFSTLDKSAVAGLKDSIDDALGRALALDSTFRSSLGQSNGTAEDEVRPGSVKVKMRDEHGKVVTLLLNRYVDLSRMQGSWPLQQSKNKEDDCTTAGEQQQEQLAQEFTEDPSSDEHT